MRKFSSAERVLFVAAVIFVAAWAALSLHKDGRSAPSASAAPVSAPLSSKIAAKEASVRRLLSVESRRIEIAAEAVKYRDYLGPDRSSRELEWGGLLKEIEVLAKKSSVRLAAVKPGPVIPREGWQEYRVDIESENTPMSSLLRFIGALQASPELFKVAQLKIVTSPQKDRRSFRASITLSKAAFSS